MFIGEGHWPLLLSKTSGVQLNNLYGRDNSFFCLIRTAFNMAFTYLTVLQDQNLHIQTYRVSHQLVLNFDFNF